MCSVTSAIQSGEPYRAVPYYCSGTVIWQKKDRFRALNGFSAARNLYRYLLNSVLIIVYTIVACAFKRKSSAARFA